MNTLLGRCCLPCSVVAVFLFAAATLTVALFTVAMENCRVDSGPVQLVLCLLWFLAAFVTVHHCRGDVTHRYPRIIATAWLTICAIFYESLAIERMLVLWPDRWTSECRRGWEAFGKCPSYCDACIVCSSSKPVAYERFGVACALLLLNMLLFMATFAADMVRTRREAIVFRALATSEPDDDDANEAPEQTDNAAT